MSGIEDAIVHLPRHITAPGTPGISLKEQALERHRRERYERELCEYKGCKITGEHRHLSMPDPEGHTRLEIIRAKLNGDTEFLDAILRSG